jgi:hypothetical protein
MRGWKMQVAVANLKRHPQVPGIPLLSWMPYVTYEDYCCLLGANLQLHRRRRTIRAW